MSSITSLPRWAKALTIASTALLLAACAAGEPSASTDAGAPGELEVVKVGVIPTVDFVPVYLAQQEGYFEEEGLQVEVQVNQNMAAITPSVLNGQLQFGTAASTPFISAIAKGMTITAIANSSSRTDVADDDPSAILAMPDRGIQSPKDLVGKTVAVNALGAVSHVTAAAAIDKDGADHTQATFVAMPFPEMVAALERGSIDAAVVYEPFYVQGLASGAQTIANLNAGILPPGTNTLMFTSQQFAAEHADTVERFQRAINKATLAAAANPDLVAGVLESELGLSPDLIENMRFPQYSDELGAQGLQDMADLMLRLGFLDGNVDVAGSIWTPQG